jgi:hypothetical protein
MTQYSNDCECHTGEIAESIAYEGFCGVPATENNKEIYHKYMREISWR